MAGGSVDGLVSGLDTTTIISQLMQLERVPQLRLQQQQASAKKILEIYQALNTKFKALETAASAISRPLDWKVVKATSSHTDAVAATATSAAQMGTLSFSVQQLARGGSVVSANSVASTSVVVANGPVLVAKGADVLGFSAVQGLSGLSVGKHTIEVTKATSGAVQRSAAALEAPIDVVDSGNGKGTLALSIDGNAVNVEIDAGSYSAEDLADALTEASGGLFTASIDAEDRLVLTTTREGSSASLAITGGTISSLFDGGAGLPGVSVGTDGAIIVDGGEEIVVDSAGNGVSTTLDGVIGVTFAGGLRTGSMTAANVETGDGSLASLAAAVNQAGAGMSAAAVKVGTDQYKLQIASTTTGAASNVLVDTTNLTSGALGGFSTVQSGRDAVIRIGEGEHAYEVSSATDTMTDVLPGVTLQLRKADPETMVTVTIAQDGDALAGKVEALVKAANDALAFIKQQGSYDPETKVAGPLLADGKARMLTQQILGAVSGALAGSSLTTASVGVSLGRDGTISFDKGKFLEAYRADPDGVAALFRAGGTTSTSGGSFVAASTSARAGTYDIEITQQAAQARAASAVLAGGTITVEETISVRVGGESGTTVSYTAGPGVSLADIANGLNSRFAEKGLALAAFVEADGGGSRLVIRTAGYGSSAKFEVSSTLAGDAPGQTGLGSLVPDEWVEHVGVDVKAKTDGDEITGNGQLLTIPDGHAGAGLSLNLSGAVGDLTFTYAPGLAQRLNSLAASAVAFGTGTISTAISGRQSVISDLDRRISDWDVRLALREQNLRRQFVGLETALGKLRDQSNWLAGQLASLPTSNS